MKTRLSLGEVGFLARKGRGTCFTHCVIGYHFYAYDPQKSLLICFRPDLRSTICLFLSVSRMLDYMNVHRIRDMVKGSNNSSCHGNRKKSNRFCSSPLQALNHKHTSSSRVSQKRWVKVKEIIILARQMEKLSTCCLIHF